MTKIAKLKPNAWAAEAVSSPQDASILAAQAAQAVKDWLGWTILCVDARHGKGSWKRYQLTVNALLTRSQESYYLAHFNAQQNKAHSTTDANIEMLCHQLIEGQARIEKAIAQLTDAVSVKAPVTGSVGKPNKSTQNIPANATNKQKENGNGQ